jgi:hypothetical protein
LTSPEIIKRTIALCVCLFATLLGSGITGAAQDQVSTNGGQKLRPDEVRSVALIEQFGFSISDLKMEHQGEKNILNLIIHYRYKPNLSKDEYPDFTLIAKDIENFLGTYPDKTEYWELVNKRLTQTILQKYSALAEVTSQIEVSPTPTVRYPRTSIVTRRQPAVRSRARK